MRRGALAEATLYRLAAGAVECDANGPRIGGVALLRATHAEARAPRWRLPPLAEIEDDLSRIYGRPIGATDKLDGLRVVADALAKGELARAQIATLLLRLPDPPPVGREPADRAELEKRLRVSGLLKDWNPDEHPRVGVPPNPGWFASNGGESAPSSPKSNAKPAGAQDDSRKTEVIPICIAEGIAIITDEFGNKLSSCYYVCFGGGSFHKEFPGSGGCPPRLKPNFLN
jgi:hypothetical protein